MQVYKLHPDRIKSSPSNRYLCKNNPEVKKTKTKTKQKQKKQKKKNKKQKTKKQ